jgi:predicted GIY-YIG superfamily endonuclease
MNRRTSLYWLYDERDRLLYVGITSSPLDRFLAHAGAKEWWRVATIRLQHFETRPEAATAEAAAIALHQPPWNAGVAAGPPRAGFLTKKTWSAARYGFGRAVLHVRSRREMPREDLAKKAGLAITRVSNIELGVRIKEGAELERDRERIAAALGLTMQELTRIAEWDREHHSGRDGRARRGTMSGEWMHREVP